jgi:hypothetical protein
MMIEGSGAGSGSTPLTSGSGSRRPKNIWIWWIRIWIHNTAEKDTFDKDLQVIARCNIFE